MKILGDDFTRKNHSTHMQIQNMLEDNILTPAEYYEDMIAADEELQQFEEIQATFNKIKEEYKKKLEENLEYQIKVPFATAQESITSKQKDDIMNIFTGMPNQDTRNKDNDKIRKDFIAHKKEVHKFPHSQIH
jgi:hypothetical protein